jgi:hypothetical protein
MLVIAIIMPTIVSDIGGASFYTWRRCSIRSVRSSAAPRPAWCGHALALGADVFAMHTVGCALAPNIGSLIAARDPRKPV